MNETTRQRKERALWDKMAAGYDGRTLDRFEDAYDQSIQRTIAALEPSDRVLEIGCGTGIITLGIAPHVAGVTGTDISPEMIAVARKKAQSRDVDNVSFRVADGYDLPFDTESFDAVLVFNTLHVVKEPETLLKEARRLLRPGRPLITATDCYAEPVPLRIRLMLAAQTLLNWLGVIAFMRNYTRSELRQLMMRNGFTVEEMAVLHPAPVNAFILARKRIAD
jgi:ubiquinone/menaquinone biosynthesis C-methylase UbiE